MVTRSDWVKRTLAAYDWEICPRCGYGVPASYVGDDGCVWGYCFRDGISLLLGREYWPLRFDPDPDEGEDLPF